MAFSFTPKPFLVYKTAAPLMITPKMAITTIPKPYISLGSVNLFMAPTTIKMLPAISINEVTVAETRLYLL